MRTACNAAGICWLDVHPLPSMTYMPRTGPLLHFYLRVRQRHNSSLSTIGVVTLGGHQDANPGWRRCLQRVVDVLTS